ncbi:hypothetical protein OAR97_02675 [Arcobacteraceae bacterium]|nr:hypothetical protein [Arcobacteraceae bacterium]
MKNEPTLDQIDDYNDQESPTKRKTVKLVVLFCIVVGIAYSVIKYNYSTPSDYIGTKEQPGINIINN